jgi:competence protein ComEC
MISRSGDALASSVVVVPHHGSKSSSSAAFVDAVAPQHAIHSAGWLNQFRHPHPTTLERWAQAGARNWRTDTQGAIRIDVGVTGVQVGAERERAARYWHGR